MISLNESDVESIDSAITMAESKLDAETIEEITEASNSLSMLIQGLSQSIYQQAQQQAQAASPPSENPVPPGGDSEVIDAEIIDD